MIRAYQVKVDGKPGPWLAGMTLDPAAVSRGVVPPARLRLLHPGAARQEGQGRRDLRRRLRRRLFRRPPGHGKSGRSVPGKAVFACRKRQVAVGMTTPFRRTCPRPADCPVRVVPLVGRVPLCKTGPGRKLPPTGNGGPDRLSCSLSSPVSAFGGIDPRDCGEAHGNGFRICGGTRLHRAAGAGADWTRWFRAGIALPPTPGPWPRPWQSRAG